MERNGTIVRAGQTPHTRAASWEYGWAAETDGRPRGRHRATRRGAAGTLRRGRWQRHHVLHCTYDIRALQIAKKGFIMVNRYDLKTRLSSFDPFSKS